MTQKEYIQDISINKKDNSLIIATHKGFYCYEFNSIIQIPNSTNSIQFTHQKLIGGISKISKRPGKKEILFIGGGPEKYERNTIVIWYDYENDKEIHRFECQKNIKQIHFSSSQIIFSSDSTLFIYSINQNGNETIQLQCQLSIDEKGLFEVNNDETKIVFGTKTIGEVCLFDLHQLKEIQRITTHKHSLNCLSSMFTELIATTSEEGTVIRIWEASNGSLQKELRRGTLNAFIDCMIFSDDNKFVIVHSNHGTIHIFGLHTSLLNKTGVLTSMINSVTSFFGKEIITEYACLQIDNISYNEQVEMSLLLPTENNPNYQLIIISVTSEIITIEFSVKDNQLQIQKQSNLSLQF